MSPFLGISFPFTNGPQSFPKSASGDALIRQSILQILTTVKGERVMRPGFGTSLNRYLFENSGDDLEVLIQEEVKNALGKFESRVAVQNIIVQRSDTEVVITVNYVVLSSRKGSSLTLTQPTVGR